MCRVGTLLGEVGGPEIFVSEAVDDALRDPFEIEQDHEVRDAEGVVEEGLANDLSAQSQVVVEERRSFQNT